MANPLFRDEAMNARRGRWLGGIFLGQPPATWVLTLFAVAAAALMVLFLAVGEYTRRSRVVGQLVPSMGMASVSAPTWGNLVDMRVVEGQSVRAGEVLAVISVPGATLSDGDTAQAVGAALAQRRQGQAEAYASQRRQLLAQQAGLESQVAALQSEVDLIELELGTRRQQHTLAQEALRRLEGLREQQFITELQLQQQQGEVLQQLGALQALERQAATLRRQQLQVEQARNELPSQFASLDAAEQRDGGTLAQESAETGARAQAVIKSPASGRVSMLLAQEGQTVQAGQALLSVMPEVGDLQAHLLVPSRAVGFIKSGDSVLLRYQAFPYQKFGFHRGEVLRVSRSALSPGELGSLLGKVGAGEPFYRIVVKMDDQSVLAYGKREPLLPGMLLDADVLGERRKLWEWLVEPLFSVSGNVTMQDDSLN